MKSQVVAVYLNCLNDLKTGVRIFRLIQEAGVLQPLEMQTQSQTIRQILHEDLRKRKICATFVPHSLTDEQKQRRLTSCQVFIQSCQENPSFLDCIVIGDESWIFQYDPEKKC
jgi:hypothetical protein